MNRSTRVVLGFVATSALGCSSAGQVTTATGGTSASSGGSTWSVDHSSASSNGGASGVGGTNLTIATGGNSIVSVACVTGATQTCVGPGACVGGQVCNSDGKSWGVCDCGTGTGGATSASSLSGQPASGGTSYRATGGITSAGTGGTTSSATGGVMNSGGVPSSGGAPTTGGTAGIGCAVDVLPAQLTQVNLVILLDKSGSMGDQANSAAPSGYDWQNCTSRWNPVADALKAFFNDANSGRLYASLSFLPADGDEYSMCTVKNYSSGTSSLKVPLTLLDDAGRAKFTAKLCDCGGTTTEPSGCIVPNGATPTLAAVQGTIAYAAAKQAQYPDSKTVIVFLTDGEPGFGFTPSGATVQQHLYSCDDLPTKGSSWPNGSNCVNDSTVCTSQDDEVQKVALVIKSAPSRSIYVAGVGDLTEQTLQTWGDASGNDPINLLQLTGAEAGAALMARLESIRSASSSCAFDLPVPTAGSSIVPNETNVNYTTGAGVQSMLSRTSDGTSSTCTQSETSWYFDKPLTPTKIQLCPGICNAIQSDPKGQFQVVYGCTTQGAG